MAAASCTSWKVTQKINVGIRTLPDINSKQTGEVLKFGEQFEVVEVCSGSLPSGQQYLKLTDGRGWAFTHTKDGRLIVEDVAVLEASSAKPTTKLPPIAASKASMRAERTEPRVPVPRAADLAKARQGREELRKKVAVDDKVFFEDELRCLFNLYDLKGDGFINEDEFACVQRLVADQISDFVQPVPIWDRSINIIDAQKQAHKEMDSKYHMSSNADFKGLSDMLPPAEEANVRHHATNKTPATKTVDNRLSSSAAELHNSFQAVDLDNNNVIDFNEFQQWHLSLLQASEQHSKIKKQRLQALIRYLKFRIEEEGRARAWRDAQAALSDATSTAALRSAISRARALAIDVEEAQRRLEELEELEGPGDVTVATLAGETFTVSMSSQDTVRDLLEKVSLAIGKDSAQLVLTFSDSLLQPDEKLLRDFGVGPGVEVSVVLRAPQAWMKLPLEDLLNLPEVHGLITEPVASGLLSRLESQRLDEEHCRSRYASAFAAAVDMMGLRVAKYGEVSFEKLCEMARERAAICSPQRTFEELAQNPDIGQEGVKAKLMEALSLDDLRDKLSEEEDRDAESEQIDQLDNDRQELLYEVQDRNEKSKFDEKLSLFHATGDRLRSCSRRIESAMMATLSKPRGKNLALILEVAGILLFLVEPRQGPPIGDITDLEMRRILEMLRSRVRKPADLLKLLQESPFSPDKLEMLMESRSRHSGFIKYVPSMQRLLYVVEKYMQPGGKMDELALSDEEPFLAFRVLAQWLQLFQECAQHMKAQEESVRKMQQYNEGLKSLRARQRRRTAEMQQAQCAFQRVCTWLEEGRHIHWDGGFQEGEEESDFEDDMAEEFDEEGLPLLDSDRDDEGEESEEDEDEDEDADGLLDDTDEDDEGDDD